MDFKECLEKRYSCRDFISYELSSEEIIKIVDLAKLAPSAVNMQPVKIAFLSGASLKNLSEKLLNAVKNDLPQSHDLIIYPKVWFEPYKSRRFETGVKLYEILGIARDDKEKRLKQWHKNYEFFGAKNLAIFYIDDALSEGSVLDSGIFLANFLNAATFYGFNTCVLGSVTSYLKEIKEITNINGKILCAVAIGKASEDRVNSLRTTRIDNNEFISFI